MQTFYWNGIHPNFQTNQFQNHYTNTSFPLAMINPFDWTVVDSIDSIHFNSTKDSKTIKSIVRLFLDATTFITEKPQQMSKLLQVLQITIDALKQKCNKYKNYARKLMKENDILKVELSNIQKKSYQKCPICLKDVKGLTKLDAHIFYTHKNYIHYWQYIRTPQVFTDNTNNIMTCTVQSTSNQVVPLMPPAQFNSTPASTSNNDDIKAALMLLAKQQKDSNMRFEKQMCRFADDLGTIKSTIDNQGLYTTTLNSNNKKGEDKKVDTIPSNEQYEGTKTHKKSKKKHMKSPKKHEYLVKDKPITSNENDKLFEAVEIPDEELKPLQNDTVINETNNINYSANDVVKTSLSPTLPTSERTKDDPFQDNRIDPSPIKKVEKKENDIKELKEDELRLSEPSFTLKEGEDKCQDEVNIETNVKDKQKKEDNVPNGNIGNINKDSPPRIIRRQSYRKPPQDNSNTFKMRNITISESSLNIGSRDEDLFVMHNKQEYNNLDLKKSSPLTINTGVVENLYDDDFIPGEQRKMITGWKNDDSIDGHLNTEGKFFQSNLLEGEDNEFQNYIGPNGDALYYAGNENIYEDNINYYRNQQFINQLYYDNFSEKPEEDDFSFTGLV